MSRRLHHTGKYAEAVVLNMPLRSLVPDRIGLGLSLVLFGVPALWLGIVTNVALPAFVARGWEPLAAWFAAGSMVFVPLLAAALAGAWIAVPAPTVGAVLENLRVRRLSTGDWKLAGATLLVTIGGMAALQAFNSAIWPGLPPHPPFMQVQPLHSGQYYLLALWLPFFAANIIGEELWWRGFIQPRQETVFGHLTWVVQGLLHGLFHLSFGFGVMFILLPALFALPWAVQRSRNTSVGIVVHAGVNGPGFLAVTLGLLPA